MQKDTKTLIIAGLLMILISLSWRILVIFTGDYNNFLIESIVLLISALFIAIIPFIVGYKINSKKILPFGIILGLLVVLTDAIALYIYNMSILNGTDVIKKEVVVSMLNSGEISFFPNLGTVIFTMVLILFFVWLGSSFNKNKEVEK